MGPSHSTATTCNPRITLDCLSPLAPRINHEIPSNLLVSISEIISSPPLWSTPNVSHHHFSPYNPIHTTHGASLQYWCGWCPSVPSHNPGLQSLPPPLTQTQGRVCCLCIPPPRLCPSSSPRRLRSTRVHPFDNSHSLCSPLGLVFPDCKHMRTGVCLPFLKLTPHIFIKHLYTPSCITRLLIAASLMLGRGAAGGEPKAVCLGQSCRGQGKPFSSSFLGIVVSENFCEFRPVMSVWDKHRGVAVNQGEQPCSAAHQLALKMVTEHTVSPQIDREAIAATLGRVFWAVSDASVLSVLVTVRGG